MRATRPAGRASRAPSSSLLGTVFLLAACLPYTHARALSFAAPPAVLKLASPPGCDGPGSPPPGCARHFWAATPVALSGQGPPLLGLPDQGKHLFVYVFVGVLLVCCCVLCIMQHGHMLVVLCFLKVAIALGCCCFPRLKAWVEAQSAAVGGAEDQDEESPLLRPPFKKL